MFNIIKITLVYAIICFYCELYRSDPIDDDILAFCKEEYGQDTTTMAISTCIFVCKAGPTDAKDHFFQKANGFPCGDKKKCFASECYSSYLVDACVADYPNENMANLAIIMIKDGCSANCNNNTNSVPLVVQDGEECAVKTGTCKNGVCTPKQP